MRFRYLHMNPKFMDADGLLSGREVSEGEIIGKVATWGDFENGTSYHIHFNMQVFTKVGWVWVNPYMTLVLAYERHDRRARHRDQAGRSGAAGAGQAAGDRASRPIRPPDATPTATQQRRRRRREQASRPQRKPRAKHASRKRDRKAEHERAKRARAQAPTDGDNASATERRGSASTITKSLVAARLFARQRMPYNAACRNSRQAATSAFRLSRRALLAGALGAAAQFRIRRARRLRAADRRAFAHWVADVPRARAQARHFGGDL